MQNSGANKMEDLSWFCVRSQPKHEHIAAGNLRRLLDIEVFNPRIRFKRPSTRGPVWVTESMFPSYLFAQFHWRRMLEAVKHTFGVAGVVHFGRYWPILSAATIQELQELVGGEEVRLVEPSVKVGEQVEIADGAFAGFQGIVTRVMSAQQRVAVLLEFLGRQSTVELTISGIIKEGQQYNLT